MVHSVHIVNISKPLAHTTPYMMSAICKVQLKPGFNRSQVKTLVRTTSTQMSFPDMVSDSLCRNSSVVQTHNFISCPGGWSQPIPLVKKPDVEVLGWRGYTWSAVVRPVGL